MAGLDEDIAQMPMRMSTLVMESGGGLSGGQQQRLQIARAIARKPRLLFLDEATSALDNRTQAIVTDFLKTLHATRIVVAHRLSTIRDADRILVLKDGVIVEEGRFEELVARNGMFAELAGRQLG
jgi:ABC-type bacteriocin/lantibiotic exporter with double-glycine peptidase domain